MSLISFVWPIRPSPSDRSVPRFAGFWPIALLHLRQLHDAVSSTSVVASTVSGAGAAGASSATSASLAGAR